MTGSKDYYRGKVVLVTGGVGSIGSEITRKLLIHGPAAVRVLDNNETGLFHLEQELGNRIRPFVGDIREESRLRRAMEGVDIVFHAAALKHVPLCEYNPFEAVKTNVLGTQNLLNSAVDEEVDKVITVSTDKAVSPANVIGATKLLAERLTVTANLYKGKRRTAFSCVRFGNVTDTRGSAIPLFKEQIMRGGPLTVTDPDMTRYLMDISEAVSLMLKAAELSHGGEIFIFKLPAVRLGDLADVMVEKLAPRYGFRPQDIEVKIIGPRAGEKLHEDLLTEEDLQTAYESDEMFVVLSRTPAGEVQAPPGGGFFHVDGATRSSKYARMLSREQIAALVEEPDEAPGGGR
ncbi:MAG: polysaccharide biosynthesis protein [Actinobacteria bacterium]|nr:polysaccharide biosynthesis protein [Actinomycetota bacterium]